MYSSYTALCTRYGTNNVRAWASQEDASGKDSAIIARVNLIIEDVTARIDSVLLHTYDTPFEAMPDTPHLIQMLCEKLTAIALQMSPRGIDEDNAIVIAWKDEAETLLSELKTGKTLIPGISRVSSVPHSVKV